MTCKKGTHEKCLCLKRKGGGCVDCEKRAIETAARYGRNIHGAYVGVNGVNGDENDFAWRSAIDILRGICDYCNHDNWERCNGCMWASGNGDEDHWLFDLRVLIKKE